MTPKAAPKDKAPISPMNTWGRIGVEPQEAQAGTGDGPADDADLPHAGDVGDIEIIGELDMAGHIGEHGQAASDHDDRQDRQAIQAVSQIDGVAGADDDEIAQQDERQAQFVVDRFDEGQDQVGLSGDFRAEVQEHGGQQAKH